MIRIGVSACFMYPDAGRVVFGPKTLCYIERDMANYLSRPDVIPILLPDVDRSALRTFVASMDGIVFQGGTDVAPETFGEKAVGSWFGDRYRDEYELEVMQMAMDAGKPVFGICRGFELMNVFFGGTLYQDLPTQLAGPTKHRDAKAYDQVHHEVQLGEVYKAMYEGLANGQVNSVHHQGIKTLGAALQVEAQSSSDQLIEAFYWTGSEPGRVMGVQWHPEFIENFRGEPSLLNPDVLYDHFLSFCR